MGLHVLKDAVFFVGGHDFTAESNEVILNMDVAVKECTTFGSGGSVEYKAGLKGSELSAKGYWQAGDDTVDSDSFTNFGGVNRAATWCQTGAAGDATYMGQFGEFAYALGGSIGEMAPYTLGAKGSDGAAGVVRGMLAAAKQTVNATGVLGSVLNLGAPTSTQYVYAVLHTFGTPGTTITVQVQSDDGAGFASATTRGTIGPVTTSTGTWLARVAGPFAGETHWRLNISAITGSFSVAGAIAIQ